jgi:RNA polymerase sigma factor (sigma-70 family)
MREPVADERLLLRAARSSRDPKSRSVALTELCESHANLVMTIAAEFQNPGMELPESVCAGYAGLHEAIEQFQPKMHGPRLADYAAGRIRWHVQHRTGREARRLPMPPSLSYRQLMRLGPVLLADARRDCAREGEAPSDSGLLTRVARRVGLPIATTAEALARTVREIAPADSAVIARLDHVRAHRRLIVLADTILGFRERVVFLARCLSNADAAVPLDRLAQRLGVTPDRIAMIEASARRKIATAAWVEGLGDIPRMAPRGLPDLPELDKQTLRRQR